MTKLSLTSLANLQNEQTAVSTINANSAATATALENTLSRDGTSPNQMNGTIDMNSNHIINLPAPASTHEPARVEDMGPLITALLPSLVPTSIPIGVTAVTGRANVKSFGAVGDGTTDDTVAIQAAITSLILGGGEVYFPQGKYVISASLNVNYNNVAFRGMGEEISTIFAKNNANIVSMINWNNAFGEVSDLTIDGNRGNNGTLSDVLNPNTTGITLLAPNFILKRVEIKNVNLQGLIGGVAAQYFTAQNCYLHHNGRSTGGYGAGIKFVGGPSFIQILGCNFESNYGLTVPGTDTGSYGGGGIALDAFNCIVDSCTFLNNYNGGGTAVAENGAAGQQRFWILSNNNILTTGEPALSGVSGFELTGLAYTIVGNMMFQGKGWGVAYDLTIGNFCGDTVISGNTFIGLGQAGVGMLETGGGGGARNITITGNKFKGAAGVQAGVLSSGIVVTGNNFAEVTSPIIGAIPTTEIVVKNNYPLNTGVPWSSTSSIAFAPTGSGAVNCNGTCYYQINGKTATVCIVVNCVTSSGTGALQITNLPFTVTTACGLSGKGHLVSGKTVYGLINASSTSMLVNNFDSTFPVAAGELLVLNGTVQIN